LETFSPRDAQYLESVQLAREIVCGAYGVPTGLLGLGSSTYASLTEQNRQLYQNALAPWLTLIQEELEAQLLGEFDEPDAYLEFMLADKLKGSFEEQAAVLQASVGAPYLTRNEARARLNLTSIEGGDELVTPLNVLIGGQASPQDSVSDERQLESGLSSAPGPKAKSALGRDAYVRIRDEATKEMNQILKSNLERQRRAVLSRLGAQKSEIAEVKAKPGKVYDRARFDRELAKDLLPSMRKTAKKSAATVGEWDVDNAENWLAAVALSTAKNVNRSTQDRIESALDDLEDEMDPLEAMDDLFDEMTDSDVISAGFTLAASVANFARNESAYSNSRGTKTWIVTSSNPRASHASLNGETVPMNETFSNGARWPGDPDLDIDETANCACICDFGD